MTPKERARRSRDLHIDRSRTIDRLQRAIEVHDRTAEIIAQARIARLDAELGALAHTPDSVAS